MKTLVIYSGGMDSTVLLYHLRAQSHKLHALTVNYNQRHKVEIRHAKAITRELGIPHDIADLSKVGALFGKGSSQVDPDVAVPEGHYTSENMRATVVPNRNMIMLAIAAGVAIANGCDSVAYGAHAGDHAIYPDCRKDFAYAMEQALGRCHEPGIRLFYPFADMTKADIAVLGNAYGVPFEKTWTCYKGGEKHCGRCATCVERIEAMYIAGVNDPTEYEDRDYWRGVCC